MKFTTTAIVLGAALGVAARPSAHGHQQAHRSMEARSDFVMNAKPAPVPTKPAAEPKPKKEKAAPKSKPAPEPKPAPKPAAPVQKEKAPAKAKPSKGSGTKKPFCGGVDYPKFYKQNQKRAPQDKILYKGNVGAPGNYGCNMMMVDSDVAEEYENLAVFTNAAKQTQDCACWLKIGPKDKIDGFWSQNAPLHFSIGPGETKYLAADDNTQGGCSCGAGKVPVTGAGQISGSWAEFDFKNHGNGGWSGADASCLVPADTGGSIPGLKICGHGQKCSIINPGGTGSNAFLGGMNDEDGWGLNIKDGGDVRLEITVGYSGGD